jgi:predicted GIY-YIG superfamily endonuclease
MILYLTFKTFTIYMAYFIYRLKNKLPNGKTYYYIGSTPNPQRRIRQHNKELVGGAKCTSSKPPTWKFDWLLLTFMKKEEALSIEFHMKHPFTVTRREQSEQRIEPGKSETKNLIKNKPSKYNVLLNNYNYRYRAKIFSENINEQLEQIDVTLLYGFIYKQIPICRRQVFILMNKEVLKHITYIPINYKIVYIDELSKSIEIWNYTGMLQQL